MRKEGRRGGDERRGGEVASVACCEPPLPVTSQDCDR